MFYMIFSVKAYPNNTESKAISLALCVIEMR